MKNLFLIFINFVFTLFLISCSTSKMKVEPDLSLEEINSFMKSNYDKIESYSGNGNIQLNLLKLKTNLDFYISVKKPDRVLMDIFGPLGIDVGTLYINDDSILVYNSINEQLIITNFSSPSLQKILFNDLDKEMIYSLFFGYIDLEKFSSDSSELINDEEIIKLVKYSGEEKKEFYYSKRSKYIVKIKFFRNSSEPVFEMSISEIKKYNGLIFPVKIILTNLKTDESIALKLKEIDFNNLNDELEFKYPENVQVLRW